MVDRTEVSRQAAKNGMEVFLRNFAHIPDEKLTWTPTPTAKSALRIAAHTALYAGRFARMIRDRKLPQPEDLSSWLEQCEAEERAITSRGEVERIFRAGTSEVLDALATLQAEEIGMTLSSGAGWSMSMEFLMDLPGWHAALHTGQIDYLQTCWDDQQVYVG
jgi:hypothetical protein